MKILLTHAYFLAEDEREKRIMRPYVPLGILYVSAYLEESGYENDVFDSTFNTMQGLQQYLLENRPEIIGIYTNLMTRINVLRLIRFLRSSEELQHAKIILGGPEVRHHARNLLLYGADYLVLGEGEETMVELIRYIENGEKHGLDNIAGIAHLDENGTAVMNAEREKIKDLDILPFPARKKVVLEKYFDSWKLAHGTSTASISTMRGCPYTCKWCSRSVYGLSYRRRSPEAVVAEIQWLYDNYSMDSLWFVDDVFTISHKWLGEFCDALEAGDLKIKYECITRADRMNAEVIAQLKRSGCFRVWIGAESGSQKVIDLMDRRVEVEQVRDMIRQSRALGLQAGTFIMIGYPGETEKDILETVNHLKLSDPDHFTITIAYPIKGTALYEEVEDKMVKPNHWETHTDRDIDFKRNYSRRYYTNAVRYIVNEVNAHKARNKHELFRMSKFKVKSVLARGAMMFTK